MGQKPATRFVAVVRLLTPSAQLQPEKRLVVALKMLHPAAHALVYVSLVAKLHTGLRDGEQEQSCKK